MRRLFATIPVLAVVRRDGLRPGAKPAAKKQPLVEFEMMTWPEVKAAIAAGKTTALFYTGGTEQRGPQNVNGGHTLMGREIVKTIALRLGNAIAMPVLPYTPNNASARSAGHDRPHAGAARRDSRARHRAGDDDRLQERRPDGRPRRRPAATYADVAKKLDAKYAPEGKHVYFCDEVYAKAQGDFDKWLVRSTDIRRSSHAGIPDTSTMLYLGGDKGWVRKELIATAEGDPAPPPGPRGRGRGRADPNAPPRKNNGITGDARNSTAALGKMAFDIKIDYAVKQIQGFLANQRQDDGAAVTEVERSSRIDQRRAGRL